MVLHVHMKGEALLRYYLMWWSTRVMGKRFSKVVFIVVTRIVGVPFYEKRLYSHKK